MPRFQEKVNIGQIQTSTGAAQGALSLADRLESFKSIGLVVKGNKQAVEKAQARGAASAGQVPIERKDGLPQLPQGKEVKLFGGIEAGAHNKALRSSYLAALNNDVRTNVARIEAESENRLVDFNESISGWAKGMLSGVDPSVRGQLQGAIEERATSSRIAVQNKAIKFQNEEAKSTLEQASQTALDESMTFASNGDLRSSAMGLIEYNNNLDAQVEAGYITPSAAQEKKRDAELRATHENLVGNIRVMANGEKTLDAVNLISGVQEKIPGGMSVDEHQDLTSAMVSELNEAINLKNKLDQSGSNAVKLKQETNYSNLAIGIAEGTINANTIIKNLRNGDITSSQFDKLISTINNRGLGTDSFPLINLVQTEIRQGDNPDATRNTIIANTGINLTEQTSQSLLNSLNEFQDKESILNTSNVKRARGFITPSIRVTGPLGALDTEAEGRLASSIREYDERVLAGEDPWAVADELVGKDRLEREPNPMFGSKEDLKTSLEKLNETFDAKQMDEVTYNFQFSLIERLQTLTTNIESFNKSRKEVDANTIK